MMPWAMMQVCGSAHHAMSQSQSRISVSLVHGVTAVRGHVVIRDNSNGDRNNKRSKP